MTNNKILVFSDTHLHLAFNEKQFNFLQKIISQADRVIINGDFFDRYLNTFDEFVNSPWKGLFPLLKEKKSVYIFGNHDNKKFSDRRISLFSDVAVDHYKLIINKKTFIFEHGHKIRPTPDVQYENYGLWEIETKIQHKVESFLIRLLKSSFIKIRYGLFYNRISKKIINKKYKPENGIIYFIGHNHFGEIDEKNHFACSGMINFGFGQYLMIENGKITLHEKWYE